VGTVFLISVNSLLVPVLLMIIVQKITLKPKSKTKDSCNNFTIQR